ncbi:MAG: photosystem II protein PsbQ [Leptolyngbyaceae bacterium]|nr:photosystem II protein PsbQ [Leptolyngbyaceae bacterium]
MFNPERYRSFISLALAIVAMFIVGCSSVSEEPTPAYTPDQIALIEQYQTDLEGLRTRMGEIPALIAQKDWTNVRNLVHGPLGDLRFKMLTIAKNLSSSDQTKARDLSGEVFKYLVAVDAAAQDQNQERAFAGYDQLIATYKQFIDTIPERS